MISGARQTCQCPQDLTVSENKIDFALVPCKYIEFVNRDENIDFDEKMKALQIGFAELLKAEEQSKTELLKVFDSLGYKIELQ